MQIQQEQRREEKLCCDWLIWFAKDYGKMLHYGKLLNISRQALKFVCQNHEKLPKQGDSIITYFSVPDVGSLDPLKEIFFFRIGHVCQIETLGDEFQCKIAIQFEEPLPFKPFKITAINKIFVESQNRKTVNIVAERSLVLTK